MALKELIQNLLNKPTSPKLYCQVPNSNVLDANFTSKPFERDASYFEIRLLEMFLRDRIEYGSTYIPSIVALCEFLYDGEQRSIPFFVGNNLLKKIETYTQNEYIEFLNTRLIGPTPYLGDDVALFIGLFRVETANLFKSLFNFLENLASTFDATQISKYIDIAGICSSGLASLLGIDEMKLRIGNWDVFTSTHNDPKQFKECYLSYINCTDGKLTPNDLWIRDARLWTGPDESSLRPVRDYDYCIVRIKHLPDRDDYTKLSFHSLWKEAVELIWSEKQIEAELKMASLGQQMAVSPDLTTTHRHGLIRVYRANFEKELEAYELSQFEKDKTPAPITRSAWRGDAGMDGQTAIQRIALLTKRAGYSKDIEKGLLDISKHWDRIPYLQRRPKEFQLTDAILHEQLRQVASVSKIENPTPSELADAIATAALSPP